MLELLLLIVFGFLIGIVVSMAGVGGGIFIVPILTFFYAFKVDNATATSLTTIIFTALASTYNYSRQKRIYYKTGLVLAATSAPGAYFGSWVAGHISEKLLGLVFGTFLVIVACRMAVSFVRRRTKEKTAQVKTDSELVKARRTIIICTILGFFAGFASGLLGIGGGILIVPVMTFALGLPIHLATATSLFTIVFTATSGSAEYFQEGLINFTFALLLAAGTVVGAQVGASLSKKISGRHLGLIFSLILLVAGVNMIMKYV